MQADAVLIVTFLTELYELGLIYSSLNVARSALSSFVVLEGGATVGTHPLVTRFLKGVYTLRPPAPRYSFVWDVKTVFDYLRKLSPAVTLSMKDLTLKLVMLIALVTAQRTQTLHKLRLDCVQLTASTAVFTIMGLVKQSRPGNTGLTVRLKAYPADRRLCVYTYLKHYISRTEIFRKQGNTNCLSVTNSHTLRSVRTQLHDG